MTAHPLTATSPTADPTPCTVRQVPAGDLQIGDTVIDHGAHHRVGTIRIQGVQPIAVIAYTDSQQLHHYPARQPLIILDPAPSDSGGITQPTGR